jgi:hypothetical protein
LKRKSDFTSSRSTVASCDCINPCSTSSLLYRGFTFDAPDHQSSYIIIYIPSVFPDTVFASRDCINPFSTGILLYTGITFEVPEHQSYIYSIYICASVQFTTECTVLYCSSDRAASPKDTTLYKTSQYISYSNIIYTRSIVASLGCVISY